MIYYLSGPSEALIRDVLTELYEAATGRELPVNPATNAKEVPQSDGILQFHYLFSEWVITPGIPDAERPGVWSVSPILKAGHHCALGIVESDNNPQGVIGPTDLSFLSLRGIDVSREDEIAPDQLARLPKFQR